MSRVYKVSLLSGTNRSKNYRRAVLWSTRVSAATPIEAMKAAREIHETQAVVLRRRSWWQSVEALGRITVEEVH